MGKVFAFSDVKSCRIPKPESFDAVFKEIKERFEDCADIVSGIVCGSYVTRSHTIRSDFDCVVVYKTEALKNVADVLGHLHLQAARLHVPLEFIPTNTELAANGLHRFDLSFVNHLKWAVEKGGLLKKNFLETLNMDFEQDEKADVRDYIRFKIERFEKDAFSLTSMNEKDKTRALTKFLESPVHVARKLVALHSDPMLANNASKNAIIAAYALHVPERQVELLNLIVEIDRAYSRELTSQLQRPEAESYYMTLSRIQTSIFDVIEFLRGNLTLLNEEFKNKK